MCPIEEPQSNAAHRPTGVALSRIVLGVTGGIAAYKSAELVRLLVKDGVTVDVV
jgi:Phosphopantothenoylcysteine synthetase/decarboxylase